MDKKAAQARFARRLARIAKLHGFVKVGGVYQRNAGEVVDLLDWSRSSRHPKGGYEFNLYLSVFSPSFHERVYGALGDPAIYYHLSAALYELVGGEKGSCWTAVQDDEVEGVLDAMRAAFEAAAPDFYRTYASTASVVRTYREGGANVRKSRDLARWEAATFDGVATRDQRPEGPPPGGWP